MIKLVVLGLHGIGSPTSSYFESFAERLGNYLENKSIPRNQVLFHGIHYGDIFDHEADKVAALTDHLNYKQLRHFITHYLGDALVYQYGTPAEPRIDFYDLVHTRINDTIDEIIKRDDVDDSTALLFVAHSLGSYIISNYIWDKQRDSNQSTSFVNMGTLCGLITMGCNIPILTLGLDISKMVPITLPGYGFPKDSRVIWSNIFNKNDPLGLPLESFYDEEEVNKIDKTRIIDKVVQVGNIFERFTPICHVRYWDSKKFVKEVGKYIVSLNDLLFNDTP